MLELIFLFVFSAKVRDIAKAKGYNGRKKRWTFVGVWIISELIGAIIGSLLFGDGFGVYAFALIAAAISARGYYKYIVGLPIIQASSDEFV